MMFGIACEICWDKNCSCTEEDKLQYKKDHPIVHNDPTIIGEIYIKADRQYRVQSDPDKDNNIILQLVSDTPSSPITININELNRNSRFTILKSQFEV